MLRALPALGGGYYSPKEANTAAMAARGDAPDAKEGRPHTLQQVQHRNAVDGSMCSFCFLGARRGEASRKALRRVDGRLRSHLLELFLAHRHLPLDRVPTGPKKKGKKKLARTPMANPGKCGKNKRLHVCRRASEPRLAPTRVGACVRYAPTRAGASPS